MNAREMADALRNWAEARHYLVQERVYEDGVIDVMVGRSILGNPIIMAHFSSVHFVDIYPPVFGDNAYHWQRHDKEAGRKMTAMLSWEAERMASGEDFITMDPNPEFM